MTSNPKWGPGPWDTEPDELEWRDERTGLQCELWRNPHYGFLCGYVGVPPGHALFGWHYDDDIKLDRKYLKDGNLGDISILALFAYSKEEYDNGTAPLDLALQAHGGLTFTAEADGLWWFGFDCGHVWDLSPGMDVYFRELGSGTDPDQTYRDIDYVKGQCADLAFQLKQLEAAKELTTAKEWQA